MKLSLSTKVDCSVLRVKEGFTIELFKALAPPFPKLEVKRFDGCEKNDLVKLELNFFTHKQTWMSLIIHEQTNDELFEFIDIGKKLPFPFKKWKHHHLVEKSGTGSIISDNIEYSTGIGLFNILIYPILLLQFAYRQPVYRKLFTN